MVAELGEIIRVLAELFVVLGRTLGLILGAVQVDRLLLRIHADDGPRWQHDLLAKDPRPGVHHDVAATHVVRGLVHLADLASVASTS